jgi:ABC-type sugar transport system ATPase subunit
MAFALRYRGTPRAATRRRVEETARLLEITPLLDRTPLPHASPHSGSTISD